MTEQAGGEAKSGSGKKIVVGLALLVFMGGLTALLVTPLPVNRSTVSMGGRMAAFRPAFDVTDADFARWVEDRELVDETLKRARERGASWRIGLFTVEQSRYEAKSDTLTLRCRDAFLVERLRDPDFGYRLEVRVALALFERLARLNEKGPRWQKNVGVAIQHEIGMGSSAVLAFWKPELERVIKLIEPHLNKQNKELLKKSKERHPKLFP